MKVCSVPSTRNGSESFLGECIEKEAKLGSLVRTECMGF